MTNNSPNIKNLINETLHFLAQSGWKETRHEFFTALVTFLGRKLGAEYALVDELLPDGVTAKTVGVYAAGKIIPDLEYSLRGTPCENVMGKKLCSYHSDVQKLFPEDELLVDLGAESYVGVPLWDTKGEAIGLVAVMGQSVLINHEATEVILQLIATRCAHELEQIRDEQKIVARQQYLEDMVDTLSEEIHKRERSEEALEESMERYRALSEAAFEAIFISEKGICIEQNIIAEQMFGYSLSEAVGRPGTEWIAPQDRALVLNHMMSKYDKSYEVTALRKDGTTFPALIRAKMMHYQGRDVRITSLFDMTERKCAEDTRLNLENQLRHSQKMEAIGQLAGGVAHDFNNILTVIMGYSRLLRNNKNLDARQKERIEQICSATESASQLTKGLLTFSRKQVTEPKNANLNDIVQHAQKFIARVIGEDIQLKSISNEVQLPVKVDSGQIEQVLINLATNARDAMRNGGTLVIETGLQEIDATYVKSYGYGNSGTYACITVSDTGSGMDEKTRNSVFEPFFTTKEVGKGTGLGMAIVYGIVKQHNGFISVTSEPGVRTTFSILLPIFEPEQSVQKEAAQKDATPRGGTETILVAEDNVDVRNFMDSVLTEFGYNVIQAVDGQDAVEKFTVNRDRIALTLMDMLMPRKNGKEAYDEICQLQPGAKILFFSGYPADFLQNHGVPGEGIELIMKPVQPMELLRKMREMLE